MGDQGTVTLAIEALEIADNYLEDGKYIGFKHKKVERALEALKAFKDGVPEGLGVVMGIEDTQGLSTQEHSYKLYREAAKHLQDGIK